MKYYKPDSGHVEVESRSTFNKLRLLSAQVAPFEWSHANLDDFRVFLRHEIATGRFRPLQDLPL